MGHKPRPVRTAAVAGLVAEVCARVQQMIDGVVIEPEPATGAVRLRRRGVFATIAPAGDHVRVVLTHVGVLPDLGGALEDDGAGGRHIVVRRARDLDDVGVRTLLSAALYDDDTGGFRRRR